MWLVKGKGLSVPFAKVEKRIKADTPKEAMAKFDAEHVGVACSVSCRHDFRDHIVDHRQQLVAWPV